MPGLPVVDPCRCGVVTGAELVAVGWTAEAVRWAVRVGRLERVAAGRFAPPPPPGLDRFRRAELRLVRHAIAATLPADRVAVSHLASALHQRWSVWADDPHPCATTWDPAVRRVTGVHLHRVTDTRCLLRRGGIAFTRPARTVVDIAREYGTEPALVTGDSAVRARAVTVDDLEREVARSAGLPGIAAARPVAALIDPLAESPLESRSRWACHVHGVTMPTSQMRIYTRGGRFLGRVDHFWEEGVVGEADGVVKYRDPRDPDALVREKIRHQALHDVELEIVRWGAADLLDFTAAAARIERARVRARRRRDEGDLRWYAVPSRPPEYGFAG